MNRYGWPTGIAATSVLGGLIIAVNRPADAWLLLVPFTYIVVGWLLATRRPGNPIGWLCLAAGALFLALGVQEQLVPWLAAHGHFGAAGWLLPLSGLWVPAVAILGIHLPLRFPDGKALSRNWEVFAHGCSALTAVVFALAATDPRSLLEVRNVHNPLALHVVRYFSPVYGLLPLAILLSVASLVVRYRRADGLQRLQLRWIALSGLIVGVFFISSLLQALGFLQGSVLLSSEFDMLTFVSYGAIPVTIAIAVLRYRLYEIDRILNRAIVYLTLTGLLLGTYAGSVVLLGIALQPLTQQSDLAIAASTLIVAAVFQPARRRIQNVVNRRFFRSRYDAQRTIEAFSSRLRDQVDLDALNADLRAVVAEALQPSQISLWLRERT